MEFSSSNTPDAAPPTLETPRQKRNYDHRRDSLFTLPAAPHKAAQANSLHQLQQSFNSIADVQEVVQPMKTMNRLEVKRIPTPPRPPYTAAQTNSLNLLQQSFYSIAEVQKVIKPVNTMNRLEVEQISTIPTHPQAPIPINRIEVEQISTLPQAPIPTKLLENRQIKTVAIATSDLPSQTGIPLPFLILECKYSFDSIYPMNKIFRNPMDYLSPEDRIIKRQKNTESAQRYQLESLIPTRSRNRMRNEVEDLKRDNNLLRRDCRNMTIRIDTMEEVRAEFKALYEVEQLKNRM
jgi:hypothetical protein